MPQFPSSVRRNMQQYPVLLKLAAFTEGLTAEEQFQLHEAFDSIPLLGYDLFGAFVVESWPESFAVADTALTKELISAQS